MVKPLGHRLLIGESGSGKTASIKEAAKYLNAHFISIDASRLTTEGIVGQKITTELILASKGFKDNNKRIVVFIDEIDKLVSESLDVKSGVLDEMLCILDGNSTVIRGQENYSRDAAVVEINISSWCFILGGAFTGIRSSEKSKAVGFNSSKNMEDSSKVSVGDIIKYGMPKELVGRIGGIIQFEKISLATYKTILKDKEGSLGYYEQFFSIHGGNFSLSETELELIAQRALLLKLGVRGLYSILHSHLAPKMLSLF